MFTLESACASTGSLSFQSQYHDSGLPDHQKTWADLVLTHNTHGANLAVSCRIDKNTLAEVGLVTICSSSLTKQVIPLVYPGTYGTVALRGLPVKSFNLSVRITGPGSGFTGTQPITIESPMLLHYYVEARKGATFDTGLTNHGLEGVGVIDQIEIDCDTSDGAATLAISSDIPGGVMANRTSGTIAVPQTTGRQVLRFELATPIYGRLFRHQMAAATTCFQVYGYKVRALPIGVHVDGSQSDFWYTTPMAPGEQ